MRHLRSVCYALVLAPTTWILSAVAFTQELTGRARAEGSVEVFTGFLLLLLAGAAYAILLLPRLSPVGPVTTGVIFLAACVWVLIDPGTFDSLFPPEVRKPGFDLTLPANGLAALLAVPLLCTALSRRRWRQSHLEPVGADAPTIIWPFARPARPGTLVVPGVTGVPTSDATQVLHLGEPAGSSPGDRTQVIADPPASDDTTRPVVPTPDATQALPPADATQTLPPADATQTLPPADATQTLPPAGATQALPSIAQRPAAEATQVLPPVPVLPADPPPRTPAAGPDPADPADPAEPADPADPAEPATVDPAPDAEGSSVGASASTVTGPGGPLPADDTSPDADGADTTERKSPPADIDADGTTVRSDRPVDEASDDTTRLVEASDDTTRPVDVSGPPTTPAPRREGADSADVTRQL